MAAASAPAAIQHAAAPMSALISALDRALRVAGEDIVLRRRFGEAPNEIYATVICRARVDRQGSTMSPAGILLSKYSLIMSPTQINAGRLARRAIDDVIPPGAIRGFRARTIPTM
jgi:hypothetical protein